MTLEYEIVDNVPGRATGAALLVNDITEAAQANPGQVLDFGTIQTDSVTQGLVSNLRKRGLEANSRTVDGAVRLYVKAPESNVVAGEFPTTEGSVA